MNWRLICGVFMLLAGCNSADHNRVDVHWNQQEKVELEEKVYELVQVDSYYFRRAYFESENMDGAALDSFMTRNPEGDLVEDGEFYMDLENQGIIENGTLNLSALHPVSDQFDYQFSADKIFKVAIENLEYTEESQKVGYVLTFSNQNQLFLSDTLEFDFPPDVTFSIMDINQDGKQEIYALYTYYIINGDNFELYVYELR